MQWRVWSEGGDTGEFAEVEGSLQYSGGVIVAEGSTLTGWL